MKRIEYKEKTIIKKQRSKFKKKIENNLKHVFLDFLMYKIFWKRFKRIGRTEYMRQIRYVIFHYQYKAGYACMCYIFISRSFAGTYL